MGRVWLRSALKIGLLCDRGLYSTKLSDYWKTALDLYNRFSFSLLNQNAPTDIARQGRFRESPLGHRKSPPYLFASSIARRSSAVCPRVIHAGAASPLR